MPCDDEGTHGQRSQSSAAAAIIAERIRGADRIHVVGGPGVGKSSLARVLAAGGGRRLCHLDELAFEGPNFEPRPEDELRRQALAIAREPHWVVEGIFVGWVEPLFAGADVIVWLDHLSWREAVARILGRTLRGAVEEPAKRQGRERFFRFGDYARHTRQLLRVIVTSREYWSGGEAPRRYNVTRAQVAAALQPYAAKVVRVETADEADAVLRLVGAPPRG